MDCKCAKENTNKPIHYNFALLRKYTQIFSLKLTLFRGVQAILQFYTFLFKKYLVNAIQLLALLKIC